MTGKIETGVLCMSYIWGLQLAQVKVQFDFQYLFDTYNESQYNF